MAAHASYSLLAVSTQANDHFRAKRSPIDPLRSKMQLRSTTTSHTTPLNSYSYQYVHPKYTQLPDSFRDVLWGDCEGWANESGSTVSFVSMREKQLSYRSLLYAFVSLPNNSFSLALSAKCLRTKSRSSSACRSGMRCIRDHIFSRPNSLVSN